MQSENLILAADTSSLVLLFRGSVLRELTEWCDFIVTPEIWRELKIKSSADEIATYSYCTTLKTVNQEKIVFPPSKFSKADKTLIELYNYRECDAILSDDGEILRYCKTVYIPHYCALSLIPMMVKYEVMEKKSALKTMSILEKIGCYSDWIVETAYSMLD